MSAMNIHVAVSSTLLSPKYRAVEIFNHICLAATSLCALVEVGELHNINPTTHTDSKTPKFKATIPNPNTYIHTYMALICGRINERMVFVAKLIDWLNV
jgi:hypothetical protein